MLTQQLRCDYGVSELLEEFYVLGPAQPAMESALQR